VTALSVNLNKVALVRNSRGGERPNVLHAARVSIAAGAAGITVHPRPDMRHALPSDVDALRAMLRAQHTAIELNVEGNPFADARENGFPGFSALIERARPEQATLVPDDDDQLTSDHGWNLEGDQAKLRDRIAAYRALGARVSLFMDTDPRQIDRARALGADRIELYTGPFADVVRIHSVNSEAARTCVQRFAAAARHARSIGLGVNAGHDLDLENLPLFALIDGIDEVSIGHALIADALELGLSAAVERYVDVLAAAAGRKAAR
jgi:pyridoxine 5-phosphate synthase